VTDGPALITTLTGTVNVTDNGGITDWIAEQLLKVLRTDVTANVVRNGWPILGLAAYVPQIEEATLEGSNQQLASYGLTVARMGNFTVSLSDQDEETLKGLAKDTAYSRLAGGFQQYAAGELQLGAGQGMAKGGGGTGGAFVAAGLGLGQAATQPQQSPPPPPAPGFAGGGPGYAQPPGGGGAGGAGGAPGAPSAGTVTCPNCGTASPEGSKFCTNCGTALAPATVACPQCGTEVAAGSKFCPNCGHNMAPGAPAAGSPPPPPPPAGQTGSGTAEPGTPPSPPEK
jgi:membrane protease subunit (stomatin/prohibitin family)